MFWAAARREYANVTASDPDIQKYLRISSELQQAGYVGLTGYVHDLGHKWVASRTVTGRRTLEIGFGSGRHLEFYSGHRRDYFVSEYSAEHLKSETWGKVAGRGVQCDARRLPFADESFDCVISIYNLEHIDDVPGVVDDVRRVLRPGGVFLVALPCEGGFLWNLGRQLVTRPAFERRFGINYDKVIAWEHKHDLGEVLDGLTASGAFRILRRRMFPFFVPLRHFNLIACYELGKVAASGAA